MQLRAKNQRNIQNMKIGCLNVVRKELKVTHVCEKLWYNLTGTKPFRENKSSYDYTPAME